MKWLTILFCLICTTWLNFATGYKILGVFPTSFKSHYILGRALMKKLAEEGHEVTFVTPITTGPLPNVTEIIFDGLEEKLGAITDNLLDMQSMSIGENLRNLYSMGILITNHTLTHPVVQKLLNSNQRFDVVVMENFMNEAMIGFGAYFKAPIVELSTFGPNTWINHAVGIPSPPSYVPHPFLCYADNMNMYKRFWNLVVNIMDYAMYNLYFLCKQNEIYSATFSDPKPDFKYLVKEGVSLALLNSHFSTSYPRPLVPNAIEIGGFQINRDRKSLPTDLKAYLDSAKDGAVYFSMGSIVKSTQLAVEKREAVLRTFAKFPNIKFLWKWENPDLPGKPFNVFIQKWFPQDDVLAHPNIKLFITHGGLLSSSEAIYHGVPVIGIPFFGDQEMNMARATKNGFGLTVSYNNLTEESITWALTEMLGNNKYKVRASEISRRYRDQPSTPLDTAQYWIEYVARHKGVSHIQSSTQNLNFFQYHMIDIYLAVFLSVYLAYKTLHAVIPFLTKDAENIGKTVVGKHKKWN